MERKQTGVRNVTCGDNVIVYEPVNLYDCVLGNGVFVGPFVEIQGNTRIGDDCKIQSHTFICEYVTIGKRCFIGHGVMFANDMFREGKPNADRESWGHITVGNDVSIGSGATILAVSICDGAVIGAGSVVTKSIVEKGVYAGNRANAVPPGVKHQRKFTFLSLVMSYSWNLRPSCWPPSRVSGVQPTAARLRVGPDEKRSSGMDT